MTKKLLIAGVGGQGIVYLTNIIAEAALLSNIPVCVSEIHGLSQRGGTVTAGIGLGKYCTGFVGNANVDFLIGLEPLETQRCIHHLHKNSCVVFCSSKIAPYSVNAEVAKYPDVNSFVEYLRNKICEVIFIDGFPPEIGSLFHNIFLLGVATQMKDFPFKENVVENAIRNTVAEYHLKKSVTAFRSGLKFEQFNQPA